MPIGDKEITASQISWDNKRTRSKGCIDQEGWDKNKEKPCIFPFRYKHDLHTECIPFKDTKKGTYCATEINENTKQMEKWGFCPKP